jgi:hypothetical protein
VQRELPGSEMRQKVNREETGGVAVGQTGGAYRRQRCRKDTGGAGRGYRECRERKQVKQRE